MKTSQLGLPFPKSCTASPLLPITKPGHCSPILFAQDHQLHIPNPARLHSCLIQDHSIQTGSQDPLVPGVVSPHSLSLHWIAEWMSDELEAGAGQQSLRRLYTSQPSLSLTRPGTSPVLCERSPPNAALSRFHRLEKIWRPPWIMPNRPTTRPATEIGSIMSGMFEMRPSYLASFGAEVAVSLQDLCERHPPYHCFYVQ